MTAPDDVETTDKDDATGTTADTSIPRRLSKPQATQGRVGDEVDEFGLHVKSVQRRAYGDDGEDEEDEFHEATTSLDTVAKASVHPGSEGVGAAARDETAAAPSHGVALVASKDEDAISPRTAEGSQAPVPTSQEAKQPSKLDTSVVAKDDAAPQSAHTTASSPTTTRSTHRQSVGVSEWSHMQLAPKKEQEVEEDDGGDWQEMPAFATHTIYDDWGKVLAREEAELGYGDLDAHATGKGYTKVQLDDDAKSATSMDEDTAYLFKQGKTTTLLEEDEEGRDMLQQMEATKDILTEGQRIAYVGIVKLATMDMYKATEKLARTKNTKKLVDNALEALQLWSQKILVRLYGHMDVNSSEQVMIEQLAEHGVQTTDLTPVLMQNVRVKNPANIDDCEKLEVTSATASPRVSSAVESSLSPSDIRSPGVETPHSAAPSYHQDMTPTDTSVKAPHEISSQAKLDIDLRWTVLCDLFLVVVADSIYDARSRTLLEQVGKALSIEWIDICRFEKRITDALEMQEEADKENWKEEEHMEKREKAARNRKLVMMGLATVGGGLVIGLSAGLLAPVIGAGFAAGFATFGVAGTGTFFGGAGAAALITTTGVLTGGTVGVRASSRRMGAVKTFEYRPLHNNKRVNLIITISGWMTGKVDDVRLPFSTVDPIMGDIYSVLWEPEMLQSMGQTINILATEALTSGLQQLLGSTVLMALMAALQLPVVLTKLAYLIDNPWNVSLARADTAGLILADSLMDRNLGNRPITLCGFSIGARVIYSALKELAKKGAYGIVQNVYLFGSPMVVNKDDYTRARTVVSGRFLNGYATNDWILGYLFRATSGGIARVAGLAQVEIDGIENLDCTKHVPGHMSYRNAMPTLLREVGWTVESLEFSEIEDPDPENHNNRQRELINEIEEARKNLEKQPRKGSLKAWLMRKRAAEKREWETYDERTKSASDPKDEYHGPVLFDIDAIMKEVAEIAAEGIEVRELEATLGPMKIDVDGGDRNGNSSGPSSPPSRSHTPQSGPESPTTSDRNAHLGTGSLGGVGHSSNSNLPNTMLRRTTEPANSYVRNTAPTSNPAIVAKTSWWRLGSLGGSGKDQSKETSKSTGVSPISPHSTAVAHSTIPAVVLESQHPPRPPPSTRTASGSSSRRVSHQHSREPSLSFDPEDELSPKTTTQGSNVAARLPYSLERNLSGSVNGGWRSVGGDGRSSAGHSRGSSVADAPHIYSGAVGRPSLQQASSSSLALVTERGGDATGAANGGVPLAHAAAGGGVIVAGSAAAVVALEHNAWDDTDEFGNPAGGEVEMSFE